MPSFISIFESLCCGLTMHKYSLKSLLSEVEFSTTKKVDNQTPRERGGTQLLYHSASCMSDAVVNAWLPTLMSNVACRGMRLNAHPDVSWVQPRSCGLSFFYELNVLKYLFIVRKHIFEIIIYIYLYLVCFQVVCDK